MDNQNNITYFIIIGIGMTVGCYNILQSIFKKCLNNRCTTSPDISIPEEIIISPILDSNSISNIKEISIDCQKNNIIKTLQNNSLLINKENVKQQDECIICYEDLNTDNVRLLHCFHLYHDKCLNQWLTHKLTINCPICDQTINKEIETISVSI